MPWLQTQPVFERTQFIVAYESGLYSMTELAFRFGVSRKIAYKWRDRFLEGGLDALKDKSRAPKTCPHKTDPAVAKLLVKARMQHPHWGARTLLVVVARQHPHLALPSHAATHEILRRAGLIESKSRRRPKPQHPRSRALKPEAPNAVWTADYKGQFLLGNRVYCYPLTVLDAFSRYLLGCQAFDSVAGYHTRKAFTRLFATYGLPAAIRTDNGVPFASGQAIHRLSKLSVYFLKLGIELDRIDPGKPQQNGAHERMHRTLKADTTRPPERTLREQQARFDHFRSEYNEIRPHQALAFETPASRYTPSPRPLPRKLPQPHYADHAERRTITKNGTVKFKGHHYFLSETLAREHVGLQEIDDGVWSIYFYNLLLGRLDLQIRSFIP